MSFAGQGPCPRAATTHAAVPMHSRPRNRVRFSSQPELTDGYKAIVAEGLGLHL